MANARLVAIAGGSGFIGRAIARRLATVPDTRVRVLSRNPARARSLFADTKNLDFVAAEVTQPHSLAAAVAGSDAVINAVQFDGFPVEDPARGRTFERIDYGGTLALLDQAQAAGARQFIYFSGAAVDERSSHPGFRAKARAERAVADSGLDYTVFRPSLVVGPGDRALRLLVTAIRYAPVFVVPGNGRQRVQPIWIEDLAACAVMALTNPVARNRIFGAGGPEVFTFDELVTLIMEIVGHPRPLLHIPQGLLHAVGAVAAKLPRPVFSSDAITFLNSDNVCDTGPLIAAFGIKLTPVRQALAYLARSAPASA